MRIIETSNYGEDYINEFFIGGIFHKDMANAIVNAYIRHMPEKSNRIWQVVPDGYQLQGSFEP